MEFNPLKLLRTLFTDLNFSVFWADFSAHLLITVAELVLAWFVWWLTVKVVFRLLKGVVKRTKVTWDDELLERKFFYRLAWLAPAAVIRTLGPTLLDDGWKLLNLSVTLADLAIIAGITLAMIDLLGFANSLYGRRPDAGRRPIKGVVQAAQVIVLTGGLIVAFSALTDKSVSGLMAGLGALSAVTMLVFQEPLKGLVAGFQISSNDMVRIGDWIELPSQGANGDVIDISLLNVTVRNWDKTYVTFPIQSLTNTGFKNWRGMSESGGRRVKRSLNIDMSTIRFLRDDEIERLQSISLIRNYLEERTEEIRKWNEEHGEDRKISPVNGRAMTNIGVFRAYARNYLSSHPMCNPNLTLLVRQLQSSPDGLPIEIYFFSRDQVWAHYEDIQSDIFDHLLAILPEFGLKAFQHPGGADIRAVVDQIPSLRNPGENQKISADLAQS